MMKKLKKWIFVKTFCHPCFSMIEHGAGHRNEKIDPKKKHPAVLYTVMNYNAEFKNYGPISREVARYRSHRVLDVCHSNFHQNPHFTPDF